MQSVTSGSQREGVPPPPSPPTTQSGSGSLHDGVGGQGSLDSVAAGMLSAAGPTPSSGPVIPAGTGPGGTPTTALSVYHLITQLCQRPLEDEGAAGASASGSPNMGDEAPGSSAQRENALLELSKKREQYEDLALVLWHSFGESCLRCTRVVLRRS